MLHHALRYPIALLLLASLVYSDVSNNPMCRPNRLFSVGGMGSGYGMGDQTTICVKGNDAISIVQNAQKLTSTSPTVRRINSDNAISALLKMEDSSCEEKLNLKSQLCYQKATIEKKTTNPVNSASTNLNTVNYLEDGKHAAMLVVEKFSSDPEREKKPPSPDQYISRPQYKVTFNEFGQKIKQEGQIPVNKKENECASCLKALQRTGGEGDCDCEDAYGFSLGNTSGKYSAPSTRSA